MLGLNQAVAQNFSFGSDLVFTFGPYSAIYTREFHPSTDSRMLIGSFYFAISYTICLIVLFGEKRWRGLAVLCWLLTALVHIGDVLFFVYPILAALAIHQQVTRRRVGETPALSLYLTIAVLLFPLGLLPLIKGTFTIVSIGITGLCVLFMWNSRLRRGAFIATLSPIASLIIFWMASGQSITSLWEYFAWLLPTISGYGEAMMAEGPADEIIAYLVASAVLLATIVRHPRLSVVHRGFLVALFSFYLFVVFKSGFVRHDAHAMISATGLLVGTVVLLTTLPPAKPRVLTSVLLVASLWAWGSIDVDFNKTSTRNLAYSFMSTYQEQWSGLQRRINDKNWPATDFDAAMSTVRSKSTIPLMPGTADVYSFDQVSLIASGNRWSPRPAFQSYFAYTSSLAALNRKHLLGSSAPDNVIFRIEPIDGRLPAMDDGLSWPILLRNYEPTQYDREFLLLKKRDPVLPVEAEHTVVSQRDVQLGESVVLPVTDDLVYIRAQLKPTLLGRVVTLLYKPSKLIMELTFDDETIKGFRLISGLLGEPTLISPLVENAREFSLLYSRAGLLTHKTVRSFKIGSSLQTSRLWQDTYSLEIETGFQPPAISLAKLYHLDPFEAGAKFASLPVADKCEGPLDSINGVAATPAIATAAMLQVDGWMALSVAKGEVPDAVFLALTDASGSSTYLKAKVRERPDVATFLKQPSLSRAGFTASGDLTKMSGTYRLGVAVQSHGLLQRCPQFDIVTTIR